MSHTDKGFCPHCTVIGPSEAQKAEWAARSAKASAKAMLDQIGPALAAMTDTAQPATLTVESEALLREHYERWRARSWLTQTQLAEHVAAIEAAAVRRDREARAREAERLREALRALRGGVSYCAQHKRFETVTGWHQHWTREEWDALLAQPDAAPGTGKP